MKVIPRASQDRVLLLAPQRYKAYVRAPAREGKANESLVTLLAEHFKVCESSIRIVRGEKSHNKVVVIHGRG